MLLKIYSSCLLRWVIKLVLLKVQLFFLFSGLRGRFPVLTRLFFQGWQKTHHQGTKSSPNPRHNLRGRPKLCCSWGAQKTKHLRVIETWSFWNQRRLGMFLQNIVGRIPIYLEGRVLFSIFYLWFLIMLLLTSRQTGIVSDGFNNDGGPENMTSLLSVKEPC